MRSIIQDQLSHIFIEGPVQTTSAGSDLNAGSTGKAYHTGLAQGYEIKGEDMDVNIPAYEVNQRFD